MPWCAPPELQLFSAVRFDLQQVWSGDMNSQANALGEGRERGILREASSGEAATSTDGLEGKGRSDAG